MWVGIKSVALLAAVGHMVACGDPAVYSPGVPGQKQGSSSPATGTHGESQDQFSKIQRPVVSSGGNVVSNLADDETLGAFPQVKFALSNAPAKRYDLASLPLKIDADATITKYAYKLDTSDSCKSNLNGYTISAVDAEVIADFSKMPLGPVFLCLVAYHFPTDRWQPSAEISVYTWQKVAFMQSFSSTLEMMDSTNCTKPTLVRIDAEIRILGKGGTSTWRRQPTAGCTNQVDAVTDYIYSVKVSETDLTGVFQKDGKTAMWFHWTFKDAKRQGFMGNWGYGELDSRPQGNWSTP